MTLGKMYPRTVYAIQHNVTKKLYIGSSKDVRTRYLGHLSQLRNGNHPVEDLQNDYDEYGEDFSLFILATINDSSERRLEYEWMRRYNSNVRGIGYNYREHAKVVNLDVDPVPYKEGLPEHSGSGEFVDVSKLHYEYIEKITSKLYDCDISLLDLILKIIDKELCNE